ncbi:response regulator transcription factor [Paenibacillus cremeus]|uniref:Response regulator transcription factor n=1 Tax=Paenibacillus cremeus TaxID=2163881 RepID=A0A559KDL4_9BACL|nr:response regulator transcription factor [Paenibacillus cremeus]TVY10208.1 response regulator transcription factor [Paenibacillus cremeus]
MKHILIIEDETSIAELQRDYLELHGFHVEMVHSGEAGLQRALEGAFDLLILDLMLPGLNGFEICRQVRAAKDLPILIVSAKKEDIDKIRGFGQGADDYLVKPFSPSELVARVKAHLARYERLVGGSGAAAAVKSAATSASAPAPAAEELCVRGLRINTASRRVYVLDREIAFTTKEFDLLSFLVMNPNRVFSKEHLFERLWGMDSAGDIMTVAVHIRKLREKIEADPSNPQYIETVWGAGYRLTV